jgi:hypothetical protein
MEVPNAYILITYGSDRGSTAIRSGSIKQHQILGFPPRIKPKTNKQLKTPKLTPPSPTTMFIVHNPYSGASLKRLLAGIATDKGMWPV